MMNSFKYCLSIVLLSFLFMGCSTTSTYYNVGVDSYALDEPSLLKSKPIIYVDQNPEAENIMLEREVSLKIKRMLMNEGFNLTDRLEEAEVVINFSYGIGEPRIITSTGVIYQPGQRTTVKNADGQVVARAQSSGTTQTVTRDQTVFDRYLILMAFDLDDISDDSIDGIIWQSITESSGRSSDLRKVLNYLIVATFEEFGINTGERKMYRLQENDPRVSQLIDGS